MDYLLKMMIFHGYVSHNQMVMGFICALVMTGIPICGMTRLHPMESHGQDERFERLSGAETRARCEKNTSARWRLWRVLSWNILESTMDLAMMGTPPLRAKIKKTRGTVRCSMSHPWKDESLAFTVLWTASGLRQYMGVSNALCHLVHLEGLRV